MLNGNKILVAVLFGIIAVLLAIVFFRKPVQVDPPSIEPLETEIELLHKSVDSLNVTIQNNNDRLQSINNEIHSLDQHITDLELEKEQRKEDFQAAFSDLNNLPIDSLKKIALYHE